MKYHMTKPAISTLLVLCLIISLTGCKNSDKNENSNNTTDETLQQSVDTSNDNNLPSATSKGRYVENICVPDPEETVYTVYHVIPEESSEKVPGKFTLNLRTNTYCLEDDGNWTKKELEWLPQATEEENYQLNAIIIGEDGKEYLMLDKRNEEALGNPFHCVYQKNGDTITEVEVPKLYELLNCNRGVNGGWTDHDFVTFSVTKDGDFILIYADNAQILKKNGQVSDLCSNINGFVSTISNGQLYALSSDLLTINVYDIESGELDHTISTEGLSLRNAFRQFAIMCNDKENNIYIQCSKGIFQLDNDTSTWKQIIDGSLNSMSTGNEFCLALYKDDDGNFWNVRGNSEYTDFQVYKYVFNPDIAAYPETEITIYSLGDIPEIRKLIVRFQNANPDVVIKYNAQITDNPTEGFKLNDYIQALNTELLAGKGPDIIYLDHMSADNLIDKGILADITDCIESNPDLYDTIKHTFARDGKIYAMPTRIQLPVISGEDDALKATSSLQALADYSMNSDKKTFSGLRQMDLIIRLYEAYKNEIYDDSKTVNIEKVKVFIENIKTISDNSNFLPDDSWCSETNSIFQLRESVSSFGLGTMYNAVSTADVMYLSKEAKATMVTLNHSYLAANIFSISNNSENKEICLSILQLLLSEEIQAIDSYEGIAINKKVVPSKSLTNNPMERGGIGYEGWIDSNGIKTEGWIPFPTEDEAKAYIPLYDEIQTPIIRDDNLDGTLVNIIMSYLTDEVSLDEAITKVNSFLYIYNGE